MAVPKAVDVLAPFLAVDESGSVRLERDVGTGAYRRREGFLAAARLLLAAAVGAEQWQDRDPLVWPGLYCFRHYVELSFKQLAEDGRPLGLRQPPTNIHQLRKLWPPVRDGIAEHLGEPAAAIATVDQAVAVFEAVDPGGDGLRYATLRGGTPSVPRDLYLDPTMLLELVDGTVNVLEAADMAFDAAVEGLRYSWDL